MITKLLSYNNDGDAAINEAAEILKAGGLVGIPTETVYGLAANALNENAVANIFKAKGRPQDNPLIVHIAQLDDLMPLADEVPFTLIQLAQHFWPGPLTMIVPKSDLVPDVVSGGLDTVAIRMPSHEIARKVIMQSGLPLAAPSANLSGSPSPTTAKHVMDDLNGRIEAVLDGGSCAVGVESTVISLAGETPVLLRPGYITLEQLESVIGHVSVDKAVLDKLDVQAKAASPGMKYKHYSPKTKIVLIKTDSDSAFEQYVNNQPDCGVICCAEQKDNFTVPYVVCGHINDPASQAQELFDALRQVDELNKNTVFARCPDKDGINLAIYNRLIRAAGFEVVSL